MISAILRAEPGADLGRERRLDELELRRLLGDRVDHALVAVADVDGHQLGVEVQDPPALGRVEVDALGVVDGDRVERALHRPREEGVGTRQGDDLLAGHAGFDGSHESSDPGSEVSPPVQFRGWRIGNYSTGRGL